MENKKEIRVQLSTICAIILIIVAIIVGLVVYIHYLKNNPVEVGQEVVNTTNMNVSKSEIEDNNSVNSENSKNENEKVEIPQLTGDYYYVGAFDLASGDKGINKDFEYDLDNDGETDKITLKHMVNNNNDPYNEGSDILSYNEEIIYQDWGGMGSVSICDLDDSDNYLEIMVYDDGPSDDPVYSFYRKIGDKIVKLGDFAVDMGFFADGKGKVVAGNRLMPRVSPRIFDCYWTIENNKFTKHTLDFSNNKNFEYTAEGFGEAEGIGYFTTELENIEEYEKNLTYGENFEEYIEHIEDYEIEKLKPGEKFKILEFVPKKEEGDVYDLKVLLSDGRAGYLMHPYGRVSFYD